MTEIGKELLKPKHWFLIEEFKWRSVASAVWTWCMTFPVLGVFFVLFSFHPARHFLIIFDVLNAIFCVKPWIIFTILSVLTASLVILHTRYYKVSAVCSVTRLGSIIEALKLGRLIHNLACGLFGVLLAHLFTHLVTGSYTYSYRQCSYETKVNDELCLNESWFIMVLFGFVLGIVNSVQFFKNHRNVLTFLHVQEAKFLFIKCKLPCMISNAASSSFKFVKHFFIVYYLVGFVLRDATAFILGVLPSESHLLSIWAILGVFPVVWNLWLLGTMFLLLWELSWQLFDVFNTQNFPFLLDSVFPEDQPKLLMENMSVSSPPIAQFLAYQSLSVIAEGNTAKRQQIFSLNHKSENGRPVWWNKLVDDCMFRINQLTNDIEDCQLRVSEGCLQRPTSTSSVSSSENSETQDHYRSSTVYRRRPIWSAETSDTGTLLQNTSMDGQHLSSHYHATLNSPSLSVPTPRLWTGRGDISAAYPDQTSDMIQLQDEKRITSRFQNFVINLRNLPVISYFMNVIPSACYFNLFREHLIFNWALQSLSYLCAASIAEDKFGVVQTRLAEIISAQLSLLLAFEKQGKISGASVHVQRLRASLVQETKSSLRRITDSFGDSLKSVNLKPEHRSRLDSIKEYNE